MSRSIIYRLAFFSSLVFSLFIYSIPIAAQTTSISGQVISKDTGLPLQEVHIFIPNTTFQTFSDSMGNYLLSSIPAGRWELYAKKAGFEFHHEKEVILSKNKGYSSSFSLTTKVNPKLNLLELSDKKRSKLVEDFMVSFLSGSQNPMAHNLGNEEALQFAKLGDSKEVYAYSDEYLIFSNDATGYVTTVYLSEPFLIGGFNQPTNYLIAYLDLIENNPEIISQRIAAREKSFINSPEFFLRKMLSGELESPNSKDSVSVSFGKYTNEYSLSFPKPFEVSISKDHPSTLSYSGDNLAVRSDGAPVFYNDLQTDGLLKQIHLLDRLPSNFNSEKVLRIANIKKNAQVMQEKVFLQTDRKHYLKGETLFFKANMIYGNPLLAPELSKVLHVEILDISGYQEYHQVFPIKNGKAFGSIFIPIELNQGNYILRGYTSWSLNYGEENGAYLPFQVHDPSLKPNAPLPELTSKGISIFSDKQTYGPDENVILNIMTRNEKGIPLAADLAIRVLDMDQAVPLDDENTINDEFELSPVDTKTEYENFTYPIESRFSVIGELEDQNKNPTAGNVTALVNGLENMAKYKAGKDGKFEIEDLTFEGEFEVAIQATTREGLPIRDISLKIQDFRTSSTLPKFEFPDLSPTKFTPLTPQEIQANMQTGEILLDEVVIDEEEKDPVGPMIYGIPDNVIQVEDLPLNGSTSQFIYLLSGRVAGMSVAGNPPSIKFRNGGEPLVMIDGVPINPPSGSMVGGGSLASRTASDVIAGINVFAIDRVEVIKRTIPMLGEGGRNGVISIFMKSGAELEKANEAMKNNFTPQLLSGYPIEQKFLDVIEAQKGNPVLRGLQPTLYWNPQVITNTEELTQKISFKSSESAGPMWIEIKGITAEGQAVEGRFIINQK